MFLAGSMPTTVFSVKVEEGGLCNVNVSSPNSYASLGSSLPSTSALTSLRSSPSRTSGPPPFGVSFNVEVTSVSSVWTLKSRSTLSME